MLRNRRYIPSEGEMLYHYCSPDTFLALCNFKTLRFSDLFAMNDFMEVHWGYHVWETAAGEVIDSVGREILDDIDKVIHEAGFQILPTAACFSRSKDVLSQWRAYGSDGKGYAVGFNANIISHMPVRALKVEYDFRTQVEEVKAFILAIHEVESEEVAPRGEEFFNSCALLATDLASFKNPAFVEEDEVRLVHLLNFQRSNDSLKLVDHGGISFGVDIPPQQVRFRMNGSTPVAYLDIGFASDEPSRSIVEVVLGPKNDSIPMGISIFLETLSHAGVSVTKSRASYR